jgi:DNA-directed RNA polymerase subunit beta'
MIYLNKILENVKSTEKTIAPEIKSLLLKILNDVIKDKVVLAKRDPADSRASIRAFKPVIVEQSSIHINPLLTGGFGADFDGDQMAIYLPITEKAQLEAKTKMTTEAAFIMPTGELTLAFNNDVIFGVYLMTPDPRDEKPIPAPKTLDEAKIC